MLTFHTDFVHGNMHETHESLNSQTHYTWQKYLFAQVIFMYIDADFIILAYRASGAGLWPCGRGIWCSSKESHVKQEHIVLDSWQGHVVTAMCCRLTM